jgi:hypothetical protein
MMTYVRALAAVSALATVAIGCGGPAAPKSPFSGKAKASAQDVGEPEAHVRFEMPTTAPGKGAVATATVTVTPKSPWHINVDFPVKLELSSSAGITLPSPSLAKVDAQRYDGDALVFEVPYRVDTCGAQEITGNVDFALCRDEACAPVTEPVTATLGTAC